MTYLLAHLSDPHIGPLPPMPLRALLNKRLTGALNWHSSRANIHNMEVLDQLIADIIAHAPDHVALTGDLVNLGFPTEFPAALDRVKALGTPERMSIIPGNHDAYVGESLAAMASSFRPYMLGDDIPAESITGMPPFPYLRRRGAIGLIGVNTGLPTLPFIAAGEVGNAQMQRLEAMLAQARAEGLFRVVMIHHPPMRHGAKFGRGLRDALAMEAVLRSQGAELVLHGHNHAYSLAHIEGPEGPIPILGAGSASAVPGTSHHRAEYTLIRITPEAPAKLHFERRGWDAHTGAISALPGGSSAME